MKRSSVLDTYRFSNESIQDAVDAINDRLKACNIEKKLLLRTSLAAEEVLLGYQERFGVEKEFGLDFIKRFGILSIVLTVSGESVDPFADRSSDDILLGNLLPDMGNAPVWSYKGGKNTVTFTLPCKTKIPYIAYIIAGAVLGIGLGLLFKNIWEEGSLQFCETYLSPVSSAISGLLSTLAAFLIFFSIASGICSMGNLETFRKIGKKMLLRFMLALVIITALLGTGTALFGDIQSGGGEGFDFGSLWKMIVEIVPGNILDAFFKGNALQIIFLSFFTGIILLSFSSKHPQLITFTSDVSALLQNMLQIVINAMPIVVFISLLSLTLSGNLSSFAQMYKFLLLHFGISFGILFFFILRTAIVHHVSVPVLIKKLLPAFLVALSTASSMAAFSLCLENGKKKFGVDERLTKISVPMAQSLFKPTAISEFALATVFVAQAFNVPITYPTLISLFISSLVFAFASPPLPGISPSCYALLFLQCGIPAEAISIVIALDSLTDRITTCTMVSCQQLELVQFAGTMGMLDKEVLRKK